MTGLRLPDYGGGGLVNLVAELEHRLTGGSVSPRLRPDLGAVIPEAETYLVVLFDGLGDGQLGHPAAAPLQTARRAALDTSFSTQTSVVTSTLATGLPPSRNGLISYLLDLPGVGVVNTLYWHTTAGAPCPLDPGGFLPAPNLAGRLVAAGCRPPAVVQPAGFVGSTLDRMLFHSAEVIGAEPGDLVEAAAGAAHSGRLVLVYLPDVDAAAHLAGRGSAEYAGALERAAGVWTGLAATLPGHAALIGTADHGHVDVRPEHRIPLALPEGIVVSGDARVAYLRGDRPAVEAAVTGLPGRWVPIERAGPLWGPPPFHPAFGDRLPDGLLFADDGYAWGFPGDDLPMIGHHGGLTEAELRIPLLVTP
jgi:hypothetical protein